MSNLDAQSASSFPTTQWTQIIHVIQSDSDSAAQAALSDFCEQYRPAIAAFFRHRGCTPENVQDYTQDFFLKRILAPWKERKTFLHAARRDEQQKFRTFLSWMLWNFLRDQFKKGGKQGGGQVPHISLEEWLPIEEGGEGPAFTQFGRDFDRIFAVEIIRKAAAQSQHSHFLEAHLRGELSQEQAAKALGISEEAFKAAYRRFRLRLAESLWAEVAKIVGPDEYEIRAEIKYLMSLFASPGP